MAERRGDHLQHHRLEVIMGDAQMPVLKLILLDLRKE